MKQYLILLLCLFMSIGIYAQNTSVDIRADWWGTVPTIDMNQLDTITLYPYHGTYDHTKDVYIWHYKGDDEFQLRVYNNTMPGVTDPYLFAPEKWIIKEVSPTELYLLVKEHKPQGIFNKKLGGYKVFLHRDNYSLLKSIDIVKVYDYRHSQGVTAPVSRN